MSNGAIQPRPPPYLAMLSDLRALRMILKNKWFSSPAIVTIALGIGINTTVFTLVNAGLFKPVDVPLPDCWNRSAFSAELQVEAPSYFSL